MRTVTRTAHYQPGFDFKSYIISIILRIYTQMDNRTLDAMGTTQDLIVKLVRLLVDDESAVRLEAQTIGTETVLRLHVAANDVGKVIGSEGRMAGSLRVVIGAIGMAQGIRYSLDILEGCC
jgi:predicted RNA-binding protein YlqC (UPF0109 family)